MGKVSRPNVKNVHVNLPCRVCMQMPAKLPVHVQCIMGRRCKSGTLRGKQQYTRDALRMYKEGFLPCGHYACPNTYKRGQKSCAERHGQEKCKGGVYDVHKMLQLLAAEEEETSSTAVSEESAEVSEGIEAEVEPEEGHVEEGAVSEPEPEPEPEHEQGIVLVADTVSLADFPVVEGESPVAREMRLTLFEEQFSRDLEEEPVPAGLVETEEGPEWELGPEYEDLKDFIVPEGEADPENPYSKEVEQIVSTYQAM